MYYNRIAFQYAATIDSAGRWSPNELLGTLVSVAPSAVPKVFVRDSTTFGP